VTSDKEKALQVDLYHKVNEFEDQDSGSEYLLIDHKLYTMKLLKRTILPILLAAIWISLSEFVRNEFFVKSFWTQHYLGLGLIFPSKPVNAALWGFWSLFMMWVVIGNLGVLPYGLLVYAIPLSILESFVATLIIKAFKDK
jgi:hypothetical protein